MIIRVGVRYSRPPAMIDIRMTGISGDFSSDPSHYSSGCGHGGVQADEGDTVILERDFNKGHVGGPA